MLTILYIWQCVIDLKNYYKYYKIDSSDRRSTTQIKLFDVDCRETPDANHILRCKYSVSQTGSDCQNTQTPALAIKCGMNNSTCIMYDLPHLRLNCPFDP